MDRGTWLFLLSVLAVGVVVILVGVAITRERERMRADDLARPPARDIPGLAPDTVAPAYVTASQAAVAPAGADPLALPADELDALRRRLTDTEPALAAGCHDRRFLTDPDDGLAVLRDAAVVVLPDGVGSIRELLPVLERAGGRPLVLVGPELPKDLVGTLAANETQRHLQVCPVTCVDADALARLAKNVGSEPVSRADLQSGWVTALGVAPVWVSDADRSWVLDAD